MAKQTRRKSLGGKVAAGVMVGVCRRCSLCYGLHNDMKEKRGQIAHVDRDRANDDPDNLVWLCLFHHDDYDRTGHISKEITAAEVKIYRNRLTTAIAAGAQSQVPVAASPTFNTSAGNNNTIVNSTGGVTIANGGRRRLPKIQAAPDSVGANTRMRAYIKYLLDRYCDHRLEAKQRGLDKRPFNRGAAWKIVERKFKCRPYELPIDRFAELVDHLQKKIDATPLGKLRQHANYHSFEDHAS